jgi:iron(III) transport system ATP-binding protein
MAQQTWEMGYGLPAARIQGLTKYYGGVLAVDNVSFTVEKGELLTLLGPSGCGKTTIMRAIAGLEKISGGEIYLQNRMVSSVPRRLHMTPERRDVGMVFQSYAIWPHMTVFENVAYPLRCRKLDGAEIRRRVREGLELVGMEAYEDRLATKLSGGQQQRVALARAIVMQPSVLLLDEPLCNLDAKLRGQMRAHIKELQQKTGLTMIYVTHDQVEAMSLSDRIIVMNAGVIEQVGTPEDVYERPLSQFVADFVGSINVIPGVVAETRPERGLLLVSTGRHSFSCVLDGNACPAVGSQVLVAIRPEKITAKPLKGADDTGSAKLSEMNRTVGEVLTNVYCGDHRELSVKVGDLSLNILAPSPIAANRGDAICLEFPAHSLRLLPRADHRKHGLTGAPRVLAAAN